MARHRPAEFNNGHAGPLDGNRITHLDIIQAETRGFNDQPPAALGRTNGDSQRQDFFDHSGRCNDSCKHVNPPSALCLMSGTGFNLV